MKECKAKGFDGRTCRRYEDLCFWMSHLETRKENNPGFLSKEVWAIERAGGCLFQAECLEYIEKHGGE
jgi:hypothetical protein